MGSMLVLAARFPAGNTKAELKPTTYFSLLLFSVILLLRECIWKAATVSLVIPVFDDTGSLGSPPRQVFYPPGSTLGDCLPFPCGE